MNSIDNSLKYRLRLMWAYKDILRNHVPGLTNRFISRFRKSQLEAAHRLQGKPTLEVAFFLTIPGMWKSDYLFREMQNDPHFHPYVVIYPYSVFKGFSQEEVQQTLERTKRFVEDKGFEYVVPYDAKRNRWQDVKKTLNPDIVIFSTPYKDIPPKYFIYHWRDRFTCYVPYAFVHFNAYDFQYNYIFHNLVGIHFLETELHKQNAVDYSRNHGENVVVSGYPGTEVFLRPDYQPKPVWKPQPHPKKKVIWAPHHTIDGGLAIASFMTFCDIMPRMAQKYADQIQFAFKPHQLLKFKLQQVWGKERTEAYYAQWAQMENTQLEETSYVDLFLTSDAMVHDSGSFTSEYLFTQNPVMFLVNSDAFSDKFNAFGKEAFACHYHGRTEEDVDKFLRDVVLKGDDPMRPQRSQFFAAHLAPKNNLLPSQRIIEIINNTINNTSE